MQLKFSVRLGNRGACGVFIRQLKRFGLDATTDGENVRLECDASPYQASQAVQLFEQQPDHDISFSF